MKPTKAKTKHRGPHLTKALKRRVAKAARRSIKQSTVGDFGAYASIQLGYV